MGTSKSSWTQSWMICSAESAWAGLGDLKRSLPTSIILWFWALERRTQPIGTLPKLLPMETCSRILNINKVALLFFLSRFWSSGKKRQVLEVLWELIPQENCRELKSGGFTWKWSQGWTSVKQRFRVRTVVHFQKCQPLILPFTQLKEMPCF